MTVLPLFGCRGLIWAKSYVVGVNERNVVELSGLFDR